jgi:hypothetical protein
MSESFAERLSRFTPDGAGLDRDALLFAAGKASARPDRRWRTLCSALAVSQLMTLGVLCWPSPAIPPTPPNGAVQAFVEVPTPPPVPEDSAFWRLREQALATEGNLPNPGPVDLPLSSEPRLHALGVFPDSMFH